MEMIREVIDWLTSMLSKQHREGDWTKSPKHDWVQAVDSLDDQVNEHGAHQSQNCLYWNLHGQTLDIVWSGVAWTCGKQLMHYPAFSRNGTEIVIQSFVFVMAKGQNHYLAYSKDIYEDKKGQKKVKVRWFHHDQEVKGAVPLEKFSPKRSFHNVLLATRSVSMASHCLKHFENCTAAFSRSLSRKVHVCFRGYFDQPILCYLNSKLLLGADSLGFGANEKK